MKIHKHFKSNTNPFPENRKTTRKTPGAEETPEALPGATTGRQLLPPPLPEYTLPEEDPIEELPDESKTFIASKNKIKNELNIMLLYALHSGKELTQETGTLIDSKNMNDLLQAHHIICQALAPATPETVTYISKFYEKKKSFTLFSPIPLVRNFTLIAIMAIISIVASSLSPEVNTENLSKGVLNNHGVSLLINLIFLSSASLMGAVFFLLSKLTRAVKEATLSPDDTTYYWTMLIMGVLSGMILSEGVSVQTDIVSASVETNRLIFAILGGFSSEIVYRILQSIMEKLQAAISAI